MHRTTLQKRLEKAEQGQSLVELAISMVVLVMVMSGLLDLGRLWFTYVALEDAVGEAALFLSIYPHCGVATDDDPFDNTEPDCEDPNNAWWRARNAAGNEMVDWNQIDEATDLVIKRPVDHLGNMLVDVGEMVSVEITYDFWLITPVIPRYTAINPIPLTVRASQTIIREDTSL